MDAGRNPQNRLSHSLSHFFRSLVPRRGQERRGDSTSTVSESPSDTMAEPEQDSHMGDSNAHNTIPSVATSHPPSSYSSRAEIQSESYGDSPDVGMHSESEWDVRDVQMEALSVDTSHTEMPGLEAIDTPTPAIMPGPSSRSFIPNPNRRARVEEDEDDDRDRRHPSQRTTASNSRNSSLPPSLPPANGLRHGRPTQPSIFSQPTANSPFAGLLNNPINPTNNNNSNAPLPQPQPQTQRPAMNGVTFSFDIGVMPMRQRGQQPPQNPTTGPADGSPPNQNLGPIPPLPGFAHLMTHLTELLARAGSFPGLEPEDPERAKRLVDSLEEVPTGLVKRLDQLSHLGSDDPSSSGGGDGACPICLDRLLTTDADNKVIDSVQTETVGSGVPSVSAIAEPAAEIGQEAPVAPEDSRIVSLPCAHVFHASCLIPWFSRPSKKTCPTCRFNIDPDDLTYVARQQPQADTPAPTTTAAAQTPQVGPQTEEAAARDALVEYARRAEAAVAQVRNLRATMESATPTGAQNSEAPASETVADPAVNAPTSALPTTDSQTPISALLPADLRALSPQNATNPAEALAAAEAARDRISTLIREAETARDSLREMLVRNEQHVELLEQRALDLEARVQEGNNATVDVPVEGASTGPSAPPVAEDTANPTAQPPLMPPPLLQHFASALAGMLAQAVAQQIPGATPPGQTGAGVNPQQDQIPQDGTGAANMPFPMPQMGFMDFMTPELEQHMHDHHHHDHDEDNAHDHEHDDNHESDGDEEEGFNGQGPLPGDFTIGFDVFFGTGPPPPGLFGGAMNPAHFPGMATGAQPTAPGQSADAEGPDAQPPPLRFHRHVDPNNPNVHIETATATGRNFQEALAQLGGQLPGGLPFGAGPARARPPQSQNRTGNNPAPPMAQPGGAQRMHPPFLPPFMLNPGLGQNRPLGNNGARQPMPAPPGLQFLFGNMNPPTPPTADAANLPPGAGVGPTPATDGQQTPAAGTGQPGEGPRIVFHPGIPIPIIFSNSFPPGMGPGQMPHLGHHFHRPTMNRKWTLPVGPGPTLRQRVERREREAGLRCYDPSCGIGPSDDFPAFTVAHDDEKRNQIHIRLPGDDTAPVCEHTLHPSCLVSAQRVALQGAEEHFEGDQAQVACSVCRADGVISRGEWDRGVIQSLDLD